MNAFEVLKGEAAKLADLRDDFEVVVDEPKLPQGKWLLSIHKNDGFSIEVEWSRHLGFGISAGYNLTFGSGVDEIFGSADIALKRIKALIERPEPTSTGASLSLSELRRVRGLMQVEVAERLGISKSGLAQMEVAAAVSSMQVETLRKLIASLGGELVLTARFPQGPERHIAVD